MWDLMEGLQPSNSAGFASQCILLSLLELESLHSDLFIVAVPLLPFLNNPPDKQLEVTQLAPDTNKAKRSCCLITCNGMDLNLPGPDVDTRADTVSWGRVNTLISRPERLAQAD